MDLRLRVLTAAVLLPLGLAACGGGTGGVATGASTAAPAPAPSPGSALRNFLLFGSSNPPPAPIVVDDERQLSCPGIDVLEGTAALRVGPPGGTASQVSHQISLGQLARECNVTGNSLALRVGVEGRVLLGTLGRPGSFTVPIRIVVRRGRANTVISRFVRLPVTIPANETQVQFVHVEEGMTLPVSNVDPGEEYTILVGLDPQGQQAERRRR